VLDLPQATRRELTTAFREHFQVPRNARSIGDRITQSQHSDFIALFLEEAQGQVQPEPATASSPVLWLVAISSRPRCAPMCSCGSER